MQQGPGAARLVRETQDAPAGGCRWPYPDAALYCRPQMQVVLSRRPRWLAWQEDALGPDEDDLASEGALLAFTASRSALKVRTASTGPNISSVQAFESRGTSVSTVG